MALRRAWERAALAACSASTKAPAVALSPLGSLHARRLLSVGAGAPGRASACVRSGARGHGWSQSEPPFAARPLHFSPAHGAAAPEPADDALSAEREALKAQTAELAEATARVQAALSQLQTVGPSVSAAQDEADEADDAKTRVRLRAVSWLGFLGLVAHWTLFARLTFYELSWDVMEPVAFLTSQAWIVIAYGYFMLTRREFSNEELARRIRSAYRAGAASARK